jgi:hypothetical protein
MTSGPVNGDVVLVHYGAAPLGPLYECAQDQVQMKPNGLWLSADNYEDNWREWCLAERYSLRHLAYAQEIVLKRCANILHLKTPYDIDDFTRRYESSKTDLDCFKIDWKAVAERHDGIIIAPYIWQRRLDLMWYYVWDCASGCIWHPRAIAEVHAPKARNVA